MLEESRNIEILKNLVESHRVLVPIEQHVKADGSFNGDHINQVWDQAFAPFIKTPLWEKNSEALRQDPSRGQSYLVFIPAEVPGRSTILVTHGGGFRIRTGCEGPNPAWFFHKLGYNTAILVYRLQPCPKRSSLEDQVRAIRLLRSKAEEWQLGPKLIASGYSAGGMLSANAATLYDLGQPDAPDPVDRYSSRPDACIIAYGAMSSTPVDMRFGPQEISQEERELFGETFEERYLFSPEKHVTPDTPPMFIWQTLSDNGMHGMRLAWALQEAHVKYELHIFDGALHGVGLADGENALGTDSKHVGSWAYLADQWLEIMGLKQAPISEQETIWKKQ